MTHIFKKGFFYVIEDLSWHTQDKGLIEIGYFPNKPFTLNNEFGTLNFSIILSGKGFYEFNGVRHTVRAPCVLVQIPGAHYYYGPDRGAHWEEFYFMFNQNQLDRMLAQGWLDQEVPVRPIYNKFSVVDAIRELNKVVESHRPRDIITHLSERVILETLMPRMANENDVLIAKIRDVAIRLQTNHKNTVVFEDIAEQLNISYSTFRRIWYELYGTSPKSYQKKQRLTEATRLLLSSNLSICEIALSLGYDDAGYFSRVFKSYIGTAPTEYRRRSAWVIDPEYQNNQKAVPDESKTDICQLDLTSSLLY